MATQTGPLRFEPFLRPMVWGGRALGTRLGKRLPTPAPYGEAWEVSDHALHRSVVAGGPWAGRTLRQLMEQHRITSVLVVDETGHLCGAVNSNDLMRAKVI